MLPSIFVRFKTGLVCSALLTTMIIAGCTTPKPQGQPPSEPQDKISAEINRYQAIIDAADNQPSLDVIRAYIALEPHAANEAARQKNIDDTWQVLTHLTSQQLSELVINANEYTLQGWLDLLNAYQTNKQDQDKLRSAIRDWQIRYPDNPATRSLPAALHQMLFTPTNRQASIGLFLPLSGQAKAFGEAIRQGFLDAQKGLPQPEMPVNATDSANVNSVNTSASDIGDTNNTTTGDTIRDVAGTDMANADTENPENNSGNTSTAAQFTISPVPVNDHPVKIYDTSSQPLANLLAQAEQDGVTLVVGPLLKPQVEQLAQINTPLNILALNKPDASQLNPNICYFSLSPEDEAKSAALHIWYQQKHNPLVLVPRTALGDRVAKAFAAEWQKLGGSNALQQSFGTITEMRQSMNRGVGIHLSGTPISVSTASVNTSTPDIDEPQADKNLSVAVTSTSREQIDAVYIVATTDELALIKPMIDMAISSREKPALYANSRSNKADAGPDFRLEMDGMQFSDVPLLTGTNIPLMKQAANKFGNDYSLMRLYAMGIDAWSLANHFAQLQQGIGFNMNGASGELSITEGCTISRQLPWMQFNNGRVMVESHMTENNSADSTSAIDNISVQNTNKNIAIPSVQ
ncbi:penicillin-binding protein activator [Xenorhabdus budapestensis]|uniref:Penicillin-binding protein activator n=1 Tax=Xenorhabdus budapestensis TaxID=290110 RepID=A0ABX7VNP2_XENBU|nr:penicillin-binding protein activator [Xenorhabdus budapestensis]QTL40249.1 penicillin-binding protein activator [Xenorhabdus budapestensis]